MTLRAWWDRLRAVLARRRAERELSEELEFHLAMQIRKHVERGMKTEQAAALARREFGNVELVKEDARDVRGARFFEELIQDVRYGLRSFARAPAFALSLVVTIGLGVGISSSAFTVFNAYVLRPFDVRDPSSLYSVNWMDRSGHYHDFSRADFDAVRRPNAALSDVVAFRTFALRLGSSAATADAVSDNYFEMLGVRPALGRTFRPDDGALPVVVLSYAAWLTRFAADSSLIGRRVLLRGSPFQVIGSRPAGIFRALQAPARPVDPAGRRGVAGFVLGDSRVERGLTVHRAAFRGQVRRAGQGGGRGRRCNPQRRRGPTAVASPGSSSNRGEVQFPDR